MGIYRSTASPSTLMKTLEILLSIATLSLIGLAPTGPAAAGPRVARPKTQPAAKTQPKAKTRARAEPHPAELRCHIEGFSDAAGTEPIKNLSSLVNAERIWLRFSVRNVGGLPAKEFKNTLRVSSGTNVDSDAYELSLLPGFSVRSPLIETRLRNGGGVSVVMEIDVDSDVPERDETLNHCMFTARNQKLH